MQLPEWYDPILFKRFVYLIYAKIIIFHYFNICSAFGADLNIFAIFNICTCSIQPFQYKEMKMFTWREKKTKNTKFKRLQLSLQSAGVLHEKYVCHVCWQIVRTAGCSDHSEHSESFNVHQSIVHSIHGVQTLHANHISYDMLVWARIEARLTVSWHIYFFFGRV